MKKIIKNIFIINILILVSIQTNATSQITVIGSGYVGLILTGTLARCGHTVCCFDIDDKKIASLQNRIVPIYEPGLEDLLFYQPSSANISFTLDPQVAFSAPVIFICVPILVRELLGLAKTVPLASPIQELLQATSATTMSPAVFS